MAVSQYLCLVLLLATFLHTSSLKSMVVELDGVRRVRRSRINALGKLKVDDSGETSVRREQNRLDNHPHFRHHQSKLEYVKSEAAKICDTFPGNMCEAMVKGARQVSRANSHGVQLQASLRERMASGKSFVFVAMGSSVTAGHDNHYNTSWPFQLELILKPIFENLGFGFELRQRAVGGYHEAPYTAGCMQNRAGSGVDALTWEWDMFHDSNCVIEGFVREAYSLNGETEQPPVIMSLDFTGANIRWLRPGITDDEAVDLRRKTFKYQDLEGDLRDRRWKPNEWYLTEEFISAEEIRQWENSSKSKSPQTDLAGNLIAQQQSRVDEIYAWLKRGHVAMTGTRPTKEAEQEMEKMARQIAQNKKFVPHLAAQELVDVGFGYEPFRITAGIEEVPTKWRSWYIAREKAFNINWHPGPLGHLLIATQLAHYILEQAQVVLASETALAVQEKPAIPRMPASFIKCGGVPRSCATGMMPHNGPSIQDLAVGGHSWKVKRSILQAMVDTSHTNFDDRMPIIGHARDSELVLKVAAEKSGDVVLVCTTPCGWTCPEHRGFITADGGKHPAWHDPKNKSSTKPPVADVEYRVDGTLVPNGALTMMNEKVLGAEGSFCAGCNVIRDVCQAVAELETGEHRLSVKVVPKTRPHDLDKNKTFVELFQVMIVPGRRI